MTVVYGKPAEHATGLARQAVVKLLCWSASAAICGVLLFLVYPSSDNRLRVPALIAGATGLLVSIFQAKTARVKFMRAYAGVIAEQTVAKVLRRSDLHAVVNGALLHRGDADHVVFGPAFAVIETKHGRGNVSVRSDGLRVGQKLLPRDPITQVLSQADVLGSVIGRRPSPVVCVSGMTGKPFQARGVWVTSPRDLPKTLKSLPYVFDSTEAGRLAMKLHTTSESNKDRT